MVVNKDVRFRYHSKRKLTIWVVAHWKEGEEWYNCLIEICKLEPKILWVSKNSESPTEGSCFGREVNECIMKGAYEFAEDKGYLESIRKRMKELGM